MAQISRYDLSALILKELGVGSGWRHIGSRRAFVVWMGPESGWDAPCDGVSGARFNPLNTTLWVPDGTSDEKYNFVPGVQNYLSPYFGAVAVASTLVNSEKKYNYGPVLEALRKPFSRPVEILDRVAESAWGTFHNRDASPNYEYVRAIIHTYRRDRSRYNSVLVGP